MMSELKIINRKNINFNPIDDHIYKALINLKNKTINMHLSKILKTKNVIKIIQKILIIEILVLIQFVKIYKWIIIFKIIFQ